MRRLLGGNKANKAGPTVYDDLDIGVPTPDQKFLSELAAILAEENEAKKRESANHQQEQQQSRPEQSTQEAHEGSIEAAPQRRESPPKNISEDSLHGAQQKLVSSTNETQNINGSEDTSTLESPHLLSDNEQEGSNGYGSSDEANTMSAETLETEKAGQGASDQTEHTVHKVTALESSETFRSLESATETTATHDDYTAESSSSNQSLVDVDGTPAHESSSAVETNDIGNRSIDIAEKEANDDNFERRLAQSNDGRTTATGTERSWASEVTGESSATLESEKLSSTATEQMPEAATEMWVSSEPAKADRCQTQRQEQQQWQAEPTLLSRDTTHNNTDLTSDEQRVEPNPIPDIGNDHDKSVVEGTIIYQAAAPLHDPSRDTLMAIECEVDKKFLPAIAMDEVAQSGASEAVELATALENDKALPGESHEFFHNAFFKNTVPDITTHESVDSEDSIGDMNCTMRQETRTEIESEVSPMPVVASHESWKADNEENRAQIFAIGSIDNKCDEVAFRIATCHNGAERVSSKALLSVADASLQYSGIESVEHSFVEITESPVDYIRHEAINGFSTEEKRRCAETSSIDLANTHTPGTIWNDVANQRADCSADEERPDDREDLAAILGSENKKRETSALYESLNNEGNLFPGTALENDREPLSDTHIKENSNGSRRTSLDVETAEAEPGPDAGLDGEWRTSTMIQETRSGSDESGERIGQPSTDFEISDGEHEGRARFVDPTVMREGKDENDAQGMQAACSPQSPFDEEKSDGHIAGLADPGESSASKVSNGKPALTEETQDMAAVTTPASGSTSCELNTDNKQMSRLRGSAAECLTSETNQFSNDHLCRGKNGITAKESSAGSVGIAGMFPSTEQTNSTSVRGRAGTTGLDVLVEKFQPTPAGNICLNQIWSAALQETPDSIHCMRCNQPADLKDGIEIDTVGNTNPNATLGNRSDSLNQKLHSANAVTAEDNRTPTFLEAESMVKSVSTSHDTNVMLETIVPNTTCRDPVFDDKHTSWLQTTRCDNQKSDCHLPADEMRAEGDILQDATQPDRDEKKLMEPFEALDSSVESRSKSGAALQRARSNQQVCPLIGSIMIDENTEPWLQSNSTEIPKNGSMICVDEEEQRRAHATVKSDVDQGQRQGAKASSIDASVSQQVTTRGNIEASSSDMLGDPRDDNGVMPAGSDSQSPDLPEDDPIIDSCPHQGADARCSNKPPPSIFEDFEEIKSSFRRLLSATSSTAASVKGETAHVLSSTVATVSEVTAPALAEASIVANSSAAAASGVIETCRREIEKRRSERNMIVSFVQDNRMSLDRLTFRNEAAAVDERGDSSALHDSTELLENSAVKSVARVLSSDDQAQASAIPTQLMLTSRSDIDDYRNEISNFLGDTSNLNSKTRKFLPSQPQSLGDKKMACQFERGKGRSYEDPILKAALLGAEERKMRTRQKKWSEVPVHIGSEEVTGLATSFRRLRDITVKTAATVASAAAPAFQEAKVIVAEFTVTSEPEEEVLVVCQTANGISYAPGARVFSATNLTTTTTSVVRGDISTGLGKFKSAPQRKSKASTSLAFGNNQVGPTSRLSTLGTTTATNNNGLQVPVTESRENCRLRQNVSLVTPNVLLDFVAQRLNPKDGRTVVGLQTAEARNESFVADGQSCSIFANERRGSYSSSLSSPCSPDLLSLSSATSGYDSQHPSLSTSSSAVRAFDPTMPSASFWDMVSVTKKIIAKPSQSALSRPIDESLRNLPFDSHKPTGDIIFDVFSPKASKSDEVNVLDQQDPGQTGVAAFGLPLNHACQEDETNGLPSMETHIEHAEESDRSDVGVEVLPKPFELSVHPHEKYHDGANVPISTVLKTPDGSKQSIESLDLPTDVGSGKKDHEEKQNTAEDNNEPSTESEQPIPTGRLAYLEAGSLIFTPKGNCNKDTDSNYLVDAMMQHEEPHAPNYLALGSGLTLDSSTIGLSMPPNAIQPPIQQTPSGLPLQLQGAAPNMFSPDLIQHTNNLTPFEAKPRQRKADTSSDQLFQLRSAKSDFDEDTDSASLGFHSLQSTPFHDNGSGSGIPHIGSKHARDRLISPQMSVATNYSGAHGSFSATRRGSTIGSRRKRDKDRRLSVNRKSSTRLFMNESLSQVGSQRDLETSQEIQVLGLRPSPSGNELILLSANETGPSMSFHDAPEFDDISEGGGMLDLALVAFSSATNAKIFSQEQRPRTSKAMQYLASVRWRQLVSKWMHTTLAKALTERACSAHYKQGESDQDFEVDEDGSFSTIAAKRRLGLELLCSSRIFGKIHNETKNLNGMIPHLADGEMATLSGFLLSLGSTEGCCCYLEAHDVGSKAKLAHFLPKATRQVTAGTLVELAESRMKSFAELLEDLVKVVRISNSREAIVSYSIGAKTKEAINKKAHRKYGGDILQVKDILRGEVVFVSEAALVVGLLNIRRFCMTKRAEDEDGEFSPEIVRVKNLFHRSGCGELCPSMLPTGYRHVIVNLRLSGQLLAEIQFQLAETFEVLGYEGYNLHKEILELEDALHDSLVGSEWNKSGEDSAQNQASDGKLAKNGDSLMKPVPTQLPLEPKPSHVVVELSVDSSKLKTREGPSSPVAVPLLHNSLQPEPSSSTQNDVVNSIQNAPDSKTPNNFLRPGLVDLSGEGTEPETSSISVPEVGNKQEHLTELRKLGSSYTEEQIMHAIQTKGMQVAAEYPRDVPVFFCLYFLLMLEVGEVDYCYETWTVSFGGSASRPMFDFAKTRGNCAIVAASHSQKLSTSAKKHEWKGQNKMPGQKRISPRSKAVLALSRQCLLRSLAVSYQGTSVGMTGWLEYGAANSFSRIAAVPFLALRELAYTFGAGGDWRSAVDVLRCQVSRCDEHLPLYHPTTLSSMLDLAGAAGKAACPVMEHNIVEEAEMRLSFYLAEQEGLCFAKAGTSGVATGKASVTFQYEGEHDEMSKLEEFADAFQAHFAREFPKLWGYDIKGRPTHSMLVSRLFLADTLSVLANCAAAGEASPNTKVKSQLYWHAAYQQYEAAFKGFIVNKKKLSDDYVVSSACGLARCLRQLQQRVKASQLLSSVVAALGRYEPKTPEEVEDEATLPELATYMPANESKQRNVNFSMSFVPSGVGHSTRLCLTEHARYEGRREQSMALCLWLMSVLAVEESPNERGRMRALSLLHAASEALQGVVSTHEEPLRKASGSKVKVGIKTRPLSYLNRCRELLVRVENEAKNLLDPVESAVALAAPRRGPSLSENDHPGVII